MAGNRQWRTIQTAKHGLVVVAGSCGPDGGSAVTNVRGQSSGFTIALSAAGVLLITFSEAWVRAQLVSAVVSLGFGTAGDQVAAFRAWTDGTSSAGATYEIVNWDISGAAVTAWSAANADYRVSFICVFDNAPRV